MIDLIKWLGEENLLGVDIWTKKYQYENESFKQWVDRVSNNNPEVAQLILDKKWLPAGRILANRLIQYRGKKITYSNCYVLPAPKDNIESIFDVAKWMAKTYSYGGGCGEDISNLAPSGAKINNAAESTTGAVSFIPIYNITTNSIGQKGRRGALMLSLYCMHPDITDFIQVKSDLEAGTSANLSIRFIDIFLNAAKLKADITLEFTRPETGESIKKVINAYDFIYQFAEMNWDFAEPGALFWDMVENWCIVSEDDAFEFAGVNPCAEAPLPAFGSCLLSSFNLSAYVMITDNGMIFDYSQFDTDVRVVVREMNILLDEGAPLHPLKEQTECALNWRQIGVGVMGVADMLIKMGIRYGSKESLELCSNIGANLANTSLNESALLAKKYGSYPNYDAESILASPYLMANTTVETYNLITAYGLRNSQMLAIAPTGSLANMLGISGSAEPIYAFSYSRGTESLHGEDYAYKIYTPIVKEYMENHNLKDEADLPEYFVSSFDLHYKERIDMQSTWQKHIDASISSTINLPKSTTVEEVIDLYFYAWEKHLKGITIFRDGCKRAGILNQDVVEEDKEIMLERGDWKPVADDTLYHPKKIYTGCGKAKLMIGYSESEKEIQDMYIIRSGQGGCERNLQGMVIAMSGMLRLGGNVFNLEKAFEGLGTCASFASTRAAKERKLSAGGCCGAALLKAIKEFMTEFGQGDKCIRTPKKKLLVDAVISGSNNKCPECGVNLMNQEGCVNCPNCGYTKCS